jgi:hypothetical protein
MNARFHGVQTPCMSGFMALAASPGGDPVSTVGRTSDVGLAGIVGRAAGGN